MGLQLPFLLNLLLINLNLNPFLNIFFLMYGNIIFIILIWKKVCINNTFLLVSCTKFLTVLNMIFVKKKT